MYETPLTLESALHTPVLTKKEERALINRVADGDEEAKEELFVRNLRLVVWISKRVHSSVLTNDDLFQAGCTGLQTAIERFDAKRTTAFSTYASHWIWQAISRAAMETEEIVHVPVDKISKRNKMHRTIAEYEAAHGETPSDEYLIEAMNIDENMLANIRRAEISAVGLDTPSTTDDDQLKLYVPVSEEEELNPLRYAETEELNGCVVRILHMLPEREEVVLRLRHGIAGNLAPRPAGNEPPDLLAQKTYAKLAGHGALSLKTIGKEFGVTPERIRQIEAKGTESFRQMMAQTGLTRDMSDMLHSLQSF